MKLIFFLGNPGNAYNFTRHNFAFLVADFYAKIHGDLQFKDQSKFNAKILKLENGTIFAKPQTFYNDVGTSLSKLINFYKLNLSDILVVCDDFNLDFGKTRLCEKGTDGANNGLKSIIATLKTGDFRRLRLGTGNDSVRKQLGDVDFVLSKFTPEERERLPLILRNISDTIEKYI